MTSTLRGMKVALLAGGLGSRLSEETETKPKPMVEIGGRPILWHIMQHYAAYDFNDFVIALGYKGDYIKRYMIDQCKLGTDLSVSLGSGRVKVHKTEAIDWNIRMVDTGQKTQTGGRIKRLAPYLGNARFMLTWGDGVSDIDLDALLDFHKSHGKLATLTAVRPPARFGHLEISESEQITEFSEKPQAQEGWINGAFFVLEPEIFDYIDGDATHFEHEPLQKLARDGQLMAYKHDSFWQCMDTIRERNILESLWASGNPPWKVTPRKATINASTVDGTRRLYWDSDEPRVIAART
jgi:glucose-1-phosphate cytidylyltransferase